MSILDQRPDAFQQRNLFYWALLGLASAADRLDALVEQHGQGPGTPPDLTDPDLLAVLGLVSLSEQVRAQLPPPRPTHNEAPGDGPAPAPRELLR